MCGGGPLRPYCFELLVELLGRVRSLPSLCRRRRRRFCMCVCGLL